MPQCTTWIDDLRAAFGVEFVDARIRSGMKGEAVFHASEGGVELGTSDDRPCVLVHYDANGIAHQVKRG